MKFSLPRAGERMAEDSVESVVSSPFLDCVPMQVVRKATEVISSAKSCMSMLMIFIPPI